MIGTIFKIGMGIAKSAIKGVKGDAEVKRGKQEVEITKLKVGSDRLRILSKIDNVFEAAIKIPITLICLFLLLDRYFVLRADMSDTLSMYFLSFSTMILGAVYGIKKWQQPKVEQIRKESEEKKLERVAQIAKSKFSMTFTFNEVIASNTAEKRGIDNTLTDASKIANLQHLCTDVIDVLKARFEAAHGDTRFICTSGYRSPTLNKAVGGVADSQHIEGEAIDIILLDKPLDLKKLYNFMKSNCEDLPLDQVIYERKGTSRWIHISSKRDGTNRHEFNKMRNGKYYKG